MKYLKLLIVGLCLFLLTGCPNPNPCTREDYFNLMENTNTTMDILMNDERLEYVDSYQIKIEKQPSHGTAILNDDNNGNSYINIKLSTDVDNFTNSLINRIHI